MKNTIFILLALILALQVFGLDAIAIALKVKGDVDIEREEDIITASTGDQLINEDILESKQNAFAALKFVDGNSIMKLFPNTILTISAKEKDGKLNKKSRLDIGNIWAKVTKKTGDFEIDTPTTVVSVKGTEFLLEIDKDGSTQLFTIEGTVNIKNKKDGKEANVDSGNKAFSTGKGEIEITQIEEGDIDETQLDESKSLEIEIENEDGDSRKLKIKFD